MKAGNDDPFSKVIDKYINRWVGANDMVRRRARQTGHGLVHRLEQIVMGVGSKNIF